MRADRTYNGNEEADVGLGQTIADQVLLAIEHLLETVEGFEQGDDGSLVGLLGRRKA